MNNITLDASTVVKQRHGKRPWRWLKIVTITLLVIIAVLLIAGILYQSVATAVDARRYPPPGRLVDVGGHQLHIVCAGQGSPTVILEAAAQAASAHWVWVQPEVAEATRVCAYDRAGMGWSDAGPEPRDARQIAAELHALLENAGVAGPYVLVGHSFGGLYARVYAAQYSGEVTGMVLVDATHPDLWEHLPPEFLAPDEDKRLAALPAFAGVGLMRLTKFFPAGPDLPAEQQAAITAFNASTKFNGAFTAELTAFPETKAQVHAAGSLGDMPLVVLTAEKTYDEQPPELAAPARQAWRTLQADLVTLSSNSSHQVVAGATHESLVTNQEHAQPTVAAILQVVEAVRANRPLVP